MHEVLLAKIIDRLATSIDQDITLQEISKLLVPDLADYSRIAIVDDYKKIKEINVSHKDPSKVQLASDIFDGYKGRPESTHGIEKILNSGKAEMIEIVDKKVLQSVKSNVSLYNTIKKIGLKSYMGVPLIARGRVIGAITLSSIRADRFYTMSDLKFAQEIANRIALTLDNANLYRQAQNEIIVRRETEKKLVDAQKRLLFLSEASKLLSSSLDYKTTINNIATLAIPYIADWYIVDMLNEKGQMELLSVAHADKKMVRFAKEYRKTHPVDLSTNSGTARVIKTGKSEFIPIVTDEMIVDSVKNKKELKLIRSLGFTSIIMVPLLVQGTVFGAMTLVSAGSKRIFSETDLSMIEELGTRIALAIQNVKLYTEAQKAIDVRDEFISVASHELKTPLTSLKLFSQVLKQQVEKRGVIDFSKYFEKMDNQVSKLAVLVEDLLNITKLEHGKMEFYMEEFNIENVLKDAIETLMPMARFHKIVLKGKSTKNIYGDKYRIYQVVTNLLTNALKYSPSAKNIDVRVGTSKAGIRLSVRDYGIGIDKKHLAKIFDQFYRVTGSKEKTYPGLGMGLYIANEIIKRHGGKMSVKSIKGKGSEFSFTLPFKKNEK